MNVVNFGGWLTGNSAVLDYLGEHNECYYIKHDFDIMRQTYGIMNYIGGDEKEKAEITRNMFVSIIEGMGRGIRSNIGLYTKHLLKNNDFKKNRKYQLKHNEDVRFGLSLLCRLIGARKIKDDNQIDYWVEWIDTLKDIFNRKNASIQLFCNPLYPICSEIQLDLFNNIFKNPKIILVTRDPFDQIFDILRLNAFKSNTPEEFFYGTSEMSDVEKIYTLIKRMNGFREWLCERYDSKQLVIVSFEDFVQKLEVRNKISRFIGIAVNLSGQQTGRFNESNSNKNIGIGRRSSTVLDLFKNNEELLRDLVSDYNSSLKSRLNVKYKL